MKQMSGKYTSHRIYTTTLTLKPDSTYDYFCGTWDNIIRTHGTWEMYSNKGITLMNYEPAINAEEVRILGDDSLRLGVTILKREKQ